MPVPARLLRVGAPDRHDAGGVGRGVRGREEDHLLARGRDPPAHGRYQPLHPGAGRDDDPVEGVTSRAGDLEPHAGRGVVHRHDGGLLMDLHPRAGGQAGQLGDGPGAGEVPRPGVEDADVAVPVGELGEALPRLLGRPDPDRRPPLPEQLHTVVDERAGLEPADDAQLPHREVEGGGVSLLPAPPLHGGPLNELDVHGLGAVQAPDRLGHVRGAGPLARDAPLLEHGHPVPAPGQLQRRRQPEHPGADHRRLSRVAHRSAGYHGPRSAGPSLPERPFGRAPSSGRTASLLRRHGNRLTPGTGTGAIIRPRQAATAPAHTWVPWTRPGGAGAAQPAASSVAPGLAIRPSAWRSSAARASS